MGKIYRIDTKKMMHYLLIYIMISANGSFLYTLYMKNWSIAVVGLFFIMCVWNKKYCDKRIIYFIAFLLANVIFVRVCSGGIGIESWLVWACEIITGFIAYKYDSDQVMDRFVNVVEFLSVISLIGFMLSLINWDLLAGILPMHIATSYGGAPFYGTVFFVLRGTTQTTLDLRNVGIFPEPGVYQIIIVSAMYVCLFEKDKIKRKSKKYYRVIIILIVTLITTGSTTGLIGGAIVIGGYIFYRSGDKSTKRKVLCIITLGVCVLGLDYVMNQDDSIVYKRVIIKLVETADTDSSGGARVLAMVSMANLVRNNPLGNGYEIMNQYILDNSEFKAAAGCGIMQFTAATGVISLAVSLLWMFYPICKHRKMWYRGIILFLIYMNMALAQTYMFYPCLLLFTFSCYKGNRRSESVDDREVVNICGI